MIAQRIRGVWSRIQGTNDRLNGSGGEIETRADAEVERPSTEEREGGNSGLFQCPECDTVYIGAEKSTCRSCRAEVTEVRSTLTAE